MANFKIVISDPKTRKAYQKEVDQNASGLMGKKIGEKLSADSMGLAGYEIEITGGSDKDGFPMRKDVDGMGRKRIILAFGPGYRSEKRGIRKRKSIRGNTVSAFIAQVNAKVVKQGQKPIAEIFGKTEAKKEEKAEGHEQKPEAPKKEERPAEKLEGKPPEAAKAEKKEEPKEKAAEKAEKKMGVKPLE